MYPSVFTTFNQTTSTSKLNSPSHSDLHNTISSTIGQLEAVVGLADSGSVLGTIIGDLRSAGSAGGGHVQTAVLGGTGQTTYTKGDLLVAQSASVLSKLAVGTEGQFLTVKAAEATGLTWISTENTVTVSLTSANLLAMYATPVQVIAAPGSDKAIIIENVLASFTYIAPQYTGGGNVILEEETSGKDLTTTIISATEINAAANGYGVGTTISAVPIVTNKAVKVTCASGAFITGAGTMKLYIKYRTVTL